MSICPVNFIVPGVEEATPGYIVYCSRKIVIEVIGDKEELEKSKQCGSDYFNKLLIKNSFGRSIYCLNLCHIELAALASICV